jgi:hypothetical protein
VSTAGSPAARLRPSRFVAEQGCVAAVCGQTKVTFAVPRRPTRSRSLIRGRRGPDLEAPPFSSRGQDLNLRPLGYEPSELPDCSTPHTQDNDANRR